MVATTRLQRWLAPKVDASRIADTARFIADDPVVVTVTRANAALPNPLTVRVVPLMMRGQESRGTDSASRQAAVTIVAPLGTDLRTNDLLAAPGGITYEVGFVQPDQRWRIEAAAAVLQ